MSYVKTAYFWGRESSNSQVEDIRHVPTRPASKHVTYDYVEAWDLFFKDNNITQL